MDLLPIYEPLSVSTCCSTKGSCFLRSLLMFSFRDFACRSFEKYLEMDPEDDFLKLLQLFGNMKLPSFLEIFVFKTFILVAWTMLRSLLR